LSGALPYVGRFVGALTLPRRKLDHHELPVGGYDDITTRGDPGQLLPGQLALEADEFVRRFAQQELLFFRREEPHERTRESLVVLLDQGVRTWGMTRLMLAAATLALGRYAERRHLPLRIAATSSAATLDPLASGAAELTALVEASDLSSHPGRALERVLEEVEPPSDVILLTHPRNLAEPALAAAARRVSSGVRLFALTVDAAGDAEFSELRRGAPLSLLRFHAETNDEPVAPPIQTAPTEGSRDWTGDVERVPFPFVFGATMHPNSLRFAFDRAGDWLLAATANGMLHAIRTDGSAIETWPRPVHGGVVLNHCEAVVGVAGGFAVVDGTPGHVLVAHYDVNSRNCRVRETRLNRDSWKNRHWWYDQEQHSIVTGKGEQLLVLDLSTGELKMRTGAGPDSMPSSADRVQVRALRCPGTPGEKSALMWRDVEYAGAAVPAKHWQSPWPFVMFDPTTGTLDVINVAGWNSFTPLSDGRPLLVGCRLESADCRGGTLAVAMWEPAGNHRRPVIRIFRGTDGVCTFELRRDFGEFCLSDDGRFIAAQGRSRRIVVKDALRGGAERCVLPVGRFHSAVNVRFGDASLKIDNDAFLHHIDWRRGRLSTSVGERAGRGAEAIRENPGGLPKWLAHDKRFVRCNEGWLIAVVDVFGQIALFEHNQQLICLFFTFRDRFAAWAPDGTRYGAPALLGTQPTPGAAETIGARLQAAWDRAQRRTYA
jgi:hypothetical protein